MQDTATSSSGAERQVVCLPQGRVRSPRTVSCYRKPEAATGIPTSTCRSAFQDDGQRSDMGIPDRTATTCRQPPEFLCAGACSWTGEFGQRRGPYPRRSTLIPAVRGEYRPCRQLARYQRASGGVEHRRSAPHDGGFRHGMPAIRPVPQRAGGKQCRRRWSLRIFGRRPLDAGPAIPFPCRGFGRRRRARSGSGAFGDHP